MMITDRRTLLAGLAGVLIAGTARAASPTLEVWKSRGCACCSAWAAKLEPLGLTVVMHEVDDLAPIRAAAGVPADLAGCHTAKLSGYVIEGHVPPEAVRRLLTERPAIAGLAVPGMPTGSPGMEMEEMPADPYDVVAFTADGRHEVFMAVRA